jgi:phosphatidylserine decarboxylase
VARRPQSIGPTASDPAFSPQHALGLVRSAIPPVHPAGRPFIGAGLLVALAGRRHRWVRRAGLLAAGACAGFFRHPPRVPPTRTGAIVAPADGEICVIDFAAPPPELGMGDAALPRISIFLSLLDAHVQRAPVSGEVVAVAHRPGRFGSADLAAASTENERTSLRIRTAGGADVVAVQVAGLLARRIICDAHVGDALSIGDTYGLIRFGSRLDTYLPAGTEPLVKVGQRAIGGETVLAELA